MQGTFQPCWNKGRIQRGARTLPLQGFSCITRDPTTQPLKRCSWAFPGLEGPCLGVVGGRCCGSHAQCCCPSSSTHSRAAPSSSNPSTQRLAVFALLFPTTQQTCMGISGQALVQGNGCRPPMTLHHLPRRRRMLLRLSKTFPWCSSRGQNKPPCNHPYWHCNGMSAPDPSLAKISLSNADLVYGQDI